MKNKKHLHDKEQQFNWDNYYKQLTVKQLTAAVIDSYIIAYSTKPGILTFDYWKSEPLYIKNHYIPGIVWRDGKTGRQRPEPAEEEIEKAIDNLYCSDYEGDKIQASLDLVYKLDRKYHTAAELIERYMTYHPLIIRRINELTEPLLYGKREDIESLVNEYQAGNDELLDRISNQLGGIIYKAEKQFSFIGNKEAFTSLAGKFSKRIPKPEGEYSDNSPAGDPEEQRLLLTTEPFNFDKVDRQQVVNRALLQALESYRPDQGAKFKTWFYKILEKDFIDLYRVYQREWKQGRKVKTLTEYNQLLQVGSINPGPYSELEEYLQPAFIEKLTYSQQHWIKLIFDCLPYQLRRNVTAEILKISDRTERRRREALQNILKEYATYNKQPVIYKQVAIGQSRSKLDFKLDQDGKWYITEGEPRPEYTTRREIAKIEECLIFRNCNKTRIIEKDKGPAVKKWPPFNKRQLAMMKHYKGFTNNDREFSHVQTFPFIGLSMYEYIPGICNSSFFPLHVLIGNHFLPVLRGKDRYIPVPQLDEWTQAKHNRRKRAKDNISVNQKIKQERKYCRCGLILTTTGECCNVPMCSCSGKLSVKKEQRAIKNIPEQKPVNAAKGGYFWPKAKKDFELKEQYYDRFYRIT